MRLLQLLPSADPRAGGVVEAVTQLVLGLTGIGAVVDVVTLDDPQRPFLEHGPLRVTALGPSKGNYGYNARLVPWLKSRMRDYDAVIVNGIWQYHSFAVWRALRDGDTPYYVFPHGMLDPWFRRSYPLKHLKKWLYWPWADYRVLRDARRVLFTSDEERQLARQSFWLYRVREQIVTLGIGLPPAAADQLKAAFLDAHPEVRERRCLLFMSRIHAKKGCDLLLEAFARVAASDPLLHLVVAGPDQSGLLRSLQSRAQSLGVAQRVSWPGMLQGDLKWGALYCADAFVLPSHQENFGIVVAEALSCGVPVLLSDKVNIWREILADGAGLVAPDTTAGTVQNLEQWLTLNTAQRSDMRRRARASFERRFTIAASAQSLLRVLESAA